jgi:hypothetical protein
MATLPFFDFTFFESKSENLAIKPLEPEKVKVVFAENNSYEQHISYYSILESEDGHDIYYRAVPINFKKMNNTFYDKEITCLARTTDGIHIERVVKTEKPKNGPTNMVLKSPGVSHNFYILNHTVDGVYFGIGGVHSQTCRNKGIYLYSSTDKQNWKKKSVVRSSSHSQKQNYRTHYDSHNVLVYNPYDKLYSCYARYNKSPGRRLVQRSTSKDMASWSKFRTTVYSEHSSEIYLPGIIIYPNSFMYLGLTTCLKGKGKRINKASQVGVLYYSYDGNYFTVIKNPFVENIKDRSRIAAGIIPSPDKKLFYIYIDHFIDSKLECYKLRKDGFTVLHTTDDNEQYLVSKLITLKEEIIHINFSTEPSGYIVIHLLDEENKILCTSVPLKGDSVKKDVVWQDRKNWIGKGKLKVVMKNAKLYSIDLPFESWEDTRTLFADQPQPRPTSPTPPKPKINRRKVKPRRKPKRRPKSRPKPKPKAPTQEEKKEILKPVPENKVEPPKPVPKPAPKPAPKPVPEKKVEPPKPVPKPAPKKKVDSKLEISLKKLFAPPAKKEPVKPAIQPTPPKPKLETSIKKILPLPVKKKPIKPIKPVVQPTPPKPTPPVPQPRPKPKKAFPAGLLRRIPASVAKLRKKRPLPTKRKRPAKIKAANSKLKPLPSANRRIPPNYALQLHRALNFRRPWRKK